MDIGRIISNIGIFLKENGAIIIGVGVATFVVGSVKMLLVNIAYRGIAREIEEHRKTLLRMSPVSMEKLKEIVRSQHQILSWMLSRRYNRSDAITCHQQDLRYVFYDQFRRERWVFAPSLYIGAMLGGFYGTLCARLFPDLLMNPSAFVLVGMGGFFAGVAKVPIASLIMVAEMTGGYALIVPLMIVSTISYLLLGKTSLYEKQVPARKDSPAHVGDFAIDILEHLFVKDALPRERQVETIPEEMGFEKFIQLFIQSNQTAFPVVDKNGNLKGILSLNDLRR